MDLPIAYRTPPSARESIRLSQEKNMDPPTREARRSEWQTGLSDDCTCFSHNPPMVLAVSFCAISHTSTALTAMALQRSPQFCAQPEMHEAHLHRGPLQTTNHDAEVRAWDLAPSARASCRTPKPDLRTCATDSHCLAVSLSA